MGMEPERKRGNEVSIKKTLILASMALATLVAMAPAGARAAVKLTDPNGTALGSGAKVTATSSNLQTTLAEGHVIKCSKVTLHLELKSNSSNHLVLEELGSATTEGCVLSLFGGEIELPVTTTSGTIGVGEDLTLTINTWGTAATTTTFVSHFYEDSGHTVQIATCHFTGKLHMRATDETDVLSIDPSHLTRTEGEETCFSEPPTIHGTFTLETSNGTPVTVDLAATPC